MDTEQDTSARVQRCVKRYGFVASAEVFDLHSEVNLQERTADLSLYGCCISVDAKKPFSAGTRVRVRITYDGAKFEGIGRVAYTTPDSYMGIAFVRVEPNNQSVLEKWVAEIK